MIYKRFFTTFHSFIQQSIVFIWEWSEVIFPTNLKTLTGWMEQTLVKLTVTLLMENLIMKMEKKCAESLLSQLTGNGDLNHAHTADIMYVKDTQVNFDTMCFFSNLIAYLQY